jgi:hypothetical protein
MGASSHPIQLESGCVHRIVAGGECVDMEMTQRDGIWAVKFSYADDTVLYVPVPASMRRPTAPADSGADLGRDEDRDGGSTAFGALRLVYPLAS